MPVPPRDRSSGRLEMPGGLTTTKVTLYTWLILHVCKSLRVLILQDLRKPLHTQQIATATKPERDQYSNP